jgi:glucarate dehydratase
MGTETPALGASHVIRVARAHVRRVRIPVAPVYVSSMYILTSTVRTIVELETTDGVVGLGEAPGAEEVFGIATALARDVVGQDLWGRRGLQQRFARNVFDNRNGRHGWSAYAAIEIAAWDAVAKSCGLALNELLGGAGASTPIDVVCPVPAAIIPGPTSREALRDHFANHENVRAVVEYAVDRRRSLGFGTFKYKSAGASAAWDVAVMHALRDALGLDACLRFDPNAAYTPAEAIVLCRELETVGIEFFEDPTEDLEGLALVRRRVNAPIATNMVVTQLDHLSPAIRLGAVDIVLADVFTWGGLLHYLTMASVLALYHIELGIHSLFETGIGTALNLHLAASLPQIRRATDFGLHALASTLIAGADLSVRDGQVRVPTAAGLGVTLDATAADAHTIAEQWAPR